MGIDQAESISPCGRPLVNQLAAEAEREGLRARASELRSIQVSDRVACDLELLATGGFSPLNRFMRQADFERVLEEMRLDDGSVFPLPVTMPVSDENDIRLETLITLRDSRNLEVRLTPAETRRRLAGCGHRDVLSFQTRNSGRMAGPASALIAAPTIVSDNPEMFYYRTDHPAYTIPTEYDFNPAAAQQGLRGRDRVCRLAPG